MDNKLYLHKVINEFLKSMQIINPATIRVEYSKIHFASQHKYYDIVVIDKDNIEHCIKVEFDSSEELSHWFCLIYRITFKCNEYYFSAVDEGAISLFKEINNILSKGNIDFITWQNNEIM